MIRHTQVLRLREYESATIGSAWDAAHKVVSPQVVSEIERLQSDHKAEYVTIGRRRITAQNYVGVIGVGDGRAIEILPKTDQAVDAARMRLVEMMTVAGLIPHLEAGIADLAASVPCLLDAFMQAYIRQLSLEWRRGRILDYRRTDENRTCLRGKMLFAEQVRRNRLRPERFYTRADQFLTDVLPSRLLKVGLDICRRHCAADATRRSATTLLAEFDDVATQHFSDAELDTVVADRRIGRFDPLMTLAKLFVRGRVPDRPGGAVTYAMLFDMNAVFERYVGCLLQRVCTPPNCVQLQVTGKPLVLRDSKRTFWLRPDAAVRRASELQLLIDTKWKLLDPVKPHEGVRNSDMYQMYAYAREYRCPRVVLIYPRSGSIASHVAVYRLHPGDDQSPRIDVETIDITKSVRQVMHELASLLQDALGLEHGRPQ